MTGRPYLDGTVLLPRLGLRVDVAFLVDTGADTTLLGSIDAERLGATPDRLSRRTETIGLFGVAEHYVEPALIAFLDSEDALHGFTVDLEITTGATDTALPSLLGRDLLDRWRMTYSRPEALLAFEVLSSDLAVDAPP